MREAREEKEAHASKHQNNFGSIDRCGRAPRKVRRQAHPAEDWQDSWAPVQTSPRTLGEFDPCGQIRPQRFFSFPRKGDAASLSGKAAKGCAVDRARPAKVSREAARGPSGGFSLFLR